MFERWCGKFQPGAPLKCKQWGTTCCKRSGRLNPVWSCVWKQLWMWVPRGGCLTVNQDEHWVLHQVVLWHHHAGEGLLVPQRGSCDEQAQLVINADPLGVMVCGLNDGLLSAGLFDQQITRRTIVGFLKRGMKNTKADQKSCICFDNDNVFPVIDMTIRTFSPLLNTQVVKHLFTCKEFGKLTSKATYIFPLDE